jgi:glycosyltransferase involved in cell wall biosynthesis
MEIQIKNQKSNNKISAIVLVGGNYDQKLLEKCLDSISWCYETIKVEPSKIKGSFSEWRNDGAKRAKGDWLFYVDSDEEVTPELKENILKVIDTNEFSAYAIPRRNRFLRHIMRWGGWYPDYVLRLINKNKFKGWFGELHEQPLIEGRVGHLKEALLHDSHMVEKTNNWSEIEAKLLFEAGHPKMNIFRFCSAGFREFWYRGVTKLGFLDGTVGVIEIIYQIYSRLITYSKLWEKQLKNESSNL